MGDDVVGAGLQDGGLYVHGGDGVKRGDAARAVKEGVLEGLEEAVEGLVRDDDALEPFDRRHAVPAGNDEAEGEAVGGGEGLPVHLPGEKGVAMLREGDGEAVREVDLAWRLGSVVDLARVRAFEDDVDGGGFDTGAGENGGEWDAGPFGQAHAAVLPLGAVSFGDEVDAPVAGALEHGDERARRHGEEVAVADLCRTVDGTFNLETRSLGLEVGDGKVAANIEAVIGGEIGVERGGGRLEIFGLRFVDDHAGLRAGGGGRGLGERAGIEGRESAQGSGRLEEVSTGLVCVRKVHRSPDDFRMVAVSSSVVGVRRRLGEARRSRLRGLGCIGGGGGPSRASEV